MENKSNNPIGVFDSGLGGLTVVRQLIKQLPLENIVYYGDTARVPYGTKSKDSIIQFSIENTKALLKHKIKMLIVACNSSSSYALPALRKKFKIPIIGVVRPGAKKAVMVSKKNRIGVIATQATVKSRAYDKAIYDYSTKAKVFSKSCPLFVPIVEAGWSNTYVTQLVAREYLGSMKKKNIDTLILGCTHYPLLKDSLRKVLGKGIQLVDSANEIAHITKEKLSKEGMLRTTKRKGKVSYLISDKPQEFKSLAKNFLGFEIKNIKKG